MLDNIKQRLPAPIRRALKRLLDLHQWRERQYRGPSPQHIKQAVLLRNGGAGAVWVETGTYLGDTTAVLARRAAKVITIEPDRALYAAAKRRFAGDPRVEVVEGLSERVFPELLPRLRGSVSFWLDGHASAGITHTGPQETPILDELTEIERNLPRYDSAVVLVDDVRCFDPRQPEFAAYPPLDALIDWARRNRMSWHIEHDIFVARR